MTGNLCVVLWVGGYSAAFVALLGLCFVLSSFPFEMFLFFFFFICSLENKQEVVKVEFSFAQADSVLSDSFFNVLLP